MTAGTLRRFVSEHYDRLSRRVELPALSVCSFVIHGSRPHFAGPASPICASDGERLATPVSRPPMHEFESASSGASRGRAVAGTPAPPAVPRFTPMLSPIGAVRPSCGADRVGDGGPELGCSAEVRSSSSLLRAGPHEQRPLMYRKRWRIANVSCRAHDVGLLVGRPLSEPFEHRGRVRCSPCVSMSLAAPSRPEAVHLEVTGGVTSAARRRRSRRRNVAFRLFAPRALTPPCRVDVALLRPGRTALLQLRLAIRPPSPFRLVTMSTRNHRPSTDRRFAGVCLVVTLTGMTLACMAGASHAGTPRA